LRNASDGTTISDFVFGPGGTFTGPGGGEALYNVYEDGSGADLLNPTAIPEPGTMSLLGLGGSALLMKLRRNRKS